MKKYHSFLAAILFIWGGMTSCNDWLEVSADSRVVQEDLFSSYEGYRTALNGIYRLLGAPELYGRELSWGMASALGQNYDENRLPYKYRDLLDKDTKYLESEAIINPVWEKGYRVIANCNNLYQETLKRDTSFFYEGAVEKNLILGEVIGLRAMMHFDLLRLFAPSPASKEKGAYIPYVTRYPEYQPVHLSVAQVMDSIIRDLEYCKQTLVYHDTLYNTYAMSSVTSRMQGNSSLVKGGMFFHSRGTRMNYFAATALLARAYLYNGDKANAYRCANDMYQYASRRAWYAFTPSYEIDVSNVNNISRKMYDDILLACVNNQMYEIYNSTRDYSSFLYYKNVDHLFGTDLDDYRKTKLIETEGSSRRWAKPTPSNEYDYTVNTVIQFQGPLAPVIRLSEVMYIMCEHLAETNLTEAKNLLQKVRSARGAKTPIAASVDKDAFLEMLYKDFVRESMSEGQTFFLYKRLNRPIYNGEYDLDMTGRYVLPKPHSETAYSNL